MPLGGNVELAWKVEEGESSGVVLGLETETRDATGGTHLASVTDLIIDPYTQGRLLLGSDQGIWHGGSRDLLIGGETTFDVDLSLAAEDKGGGVPVIVVEYLIVY
jgi:hypothetical protein